MSWSIAVLDNNVEISDECADELFAAFEGNIWYSREFVTDEGFLYFDEDHCEHMDYMETPGLFEILKKYKVNGDITFGSLEGDNAGNFWGYRFTNGVMANLVGHVSFTACK